MLDPAKTSRLGLGDAGGSSNAATPPALDVSALPHPRPLAYFVPHGAGPDSGGSDIQGHPLRAYALMGGRPLRVRR